MTVPKSIEDNVVNYVMKDLAPSSLVVHAKIGAAAIVGALASLLVCGQFGVGLSSWADAFSTHIHETMPTWLCSVICGSLFTIFPTLLLRVISSPMLFHVLFKRFFPQVIAWFGGIGSILAVFGHHGNSVDGFAIWAVAVVATIVAYSRMFEIFLPKFNLPILVQR